MKYFLPCHIPDPSLGATRSKQRSIEVLENIEYIRRCDNEAEIHVYNNGSDALQVDERIRYHCEKSMFSKNPSIGEALMLREFLIRNKGVFIKLHARCRIHNLDFFIKTEKNNIFLLKRNTLATPNQTTIDSLPYIDTRTFKADIENLKIFFNCAIERTLAGGINLEQAFLYSFLKNHESCHAIVTHSQNHPIYFGESGHGRNYSNLASQASQILKSFMYRFGLS